jgi:hypothetical protein
MVDRSVDEVAKLKYPILGGLDLLVSLVNRVSELFIRNPRSWIGDLAPRVVNIKKDG